jgi:hypothetical protein
MFQVLKMRPVQLNAELNVDLTPRAMNDFIGIESKYMTSLGVPLHHLPVLRLLTAYFPEASVHAQIMWRDPSQDPALHIHIGEESLGTAGYFWARRERRTGNPNDFLALHFYRDVQESPEKKLVGVTWNANHIMPDIFHLPDELRIEMTNIAFDQFQYGVGNRMLGGGIPPRKKLLDNIKEHKSIEIYNRYRDTPAGMEPNTLVGLDDDAGHFILVPHKYDPDGFFAVTYNSWTAGHIVSSAKVEWDLHRIENTQRI